MRLAAGGHRPDSPPDQPEVEESDGVRSANAYNRPRRGKEIARLPTGYAEWRDDGFSGIDCRDDGMRRQDLDAMAEEEAEEEEEEEKAEEES